MEDKNFSLPMDEIQKLSEIFKENNLEELTVETKEMYIKFSKERKVIPSVHLIPSIQQGSTHSSTSVTHQQAKQQAKPSRVSDAKPKDDFSDDTKYHKVKSPINGTMYRSSSPGAEPFVKEGEHVNAGQTLCIVEAMKVMNEIKSPVSGKLIKIVKNNAEVVKAGDVLMIIEMV
ncbi:MAG: acetyl-CoA carboxylase biotin carboxyl carrier protein [Brevinematales bacterium]|nr:acetyl-CoA carboxylase biotin carboxyl carrier protein [Brevinematales bacterium]